VAAQPCSGCALKLISLHSSGFLYIGRHCVGLHAVLAAWWSHACRLCIPAEIVEGVHPGWLAMLQGKHAYMRGETVLVISRDVEVKKHG
jgi:hypothetical protein